MPTPRMSWTHFVRALVASASLVLTSPLGGLANAVAEELVTETLPQPVAVSELPGETAACETPLEDSSQESRLVFTGGVSLYVLQPLFESNPAYTSLEGIGSPDTRVTSTSFDWAFKAAPKVWVGLQGETLGLRASYFQFTQDARSLSLPGGDPTGSTAITTPNPGISGGIYA